MERATPLGRGRLSLTLILIAGLLGGCAARGSDQSVTATPPAAEPASPESAVPAPADPSNSLPQGGDATSPEPAPNGTEGQPPSGAPVASAAPSPQGGKAGGSGSAAKAPAQASGAKTPAAGSGGASGAAAPAGQPAPGPAPANPAQPAIPAPATGPAKYDSGAGDKEIVFGSVSSLTGVAGFIQPQGGRAYFKYLNDKFGGVNGRKLSLNIYDDQWDVTRHAALVRQAVEQDKVFAFTAHMGVLTDHGAVAYLEEKKVPVIGGDSVDVRAWGVSPMFFPQSELEAINGGRLMGRFAASQGCKRVAAQSYNVDESTRWAASFKKGLEDAGFKAGFVYEGQNSLAETDFTAYAAQIKSAQADCMTMGQFDTHAIRLRQALKQVGHTLRMFQPSTFYSPAMRESGLFEGDYGLLGVDIPENAASNPAVAEFVANVEKYEPTLRGKVNGWAINAWAAAKIAAEAVKRMGNTLTRENLLGTLNSFTDVDLGIVPPVTFRPGPNPGSTCGNVIHIKSSKFVTLQRNFCI